MSKNNYTAHYQRQLHEAEVESLENRTMELALQKTGTRNGAIFLWNEGAQGLEVEDFFSSKAFLPAGE